MTNLISRTHSKYEDAFPAHVPTTKAKKVLAEVFQQAYVKLPETACEYRQHTNDFGIQIKELLVIGQDPDYVDNCPRLRQDIHCVAKRLGIVSMNHGFSYYPRDFFRKAHTGQITGPMKIPQEKLLDLELAINRAASKEVYANELGASISMLSNRSISGSFGGWTKLAEPVIASSRALLSDSAEPYSPFYFEGGNLFTLTNSRKEIKVLSGKLQLFTALNWLRLNKTAVSQESISKKIEQLDVRKIRRTAEKMYAQGLLKQGGQTGVINEGNLTIEQLATLLDTCRIAKRSIADGFYHLGYAKRFTWQSSDSAACREMVAKYLCQKEMANKLIADSMKVASHDVVYLPSVDVHLDLFIRPGPNCLFLADFELTEKVCAALFKNAGELNLAESDKRHLEIYIRSAQKRQTELGHLLAKTRTKLEKAGFTVVSMPGVFTYDRDGYGDKSYNFNLMNAVTGWSSTTNKYYYIIGGVEVGNLGALFMDALKAFMEQYEPQTEFYFVGRDSDPGKFSDSMKVMNSVGKSYGNVHCATFEKLTASHQKE